MVPMKDASGMRTPGNWSERAKPSFISQWTRYGSVKMSRRNPNPGRILVNPQLAGSMR